MTQPAIPLSREVLLRAPKEELIELLLLAVEGQQKATENMQDLVRHLSEVTAAKKELEDKVASMEAELILLRNRP